MMLEEVDLPQIPIFSFRLIRDTLTGTAGSKVDFCSVLHAK
jgi:hypothetical protein